jgi:hypothetical protein
MRIGTLMPAIGSFVINGTDIYIGGDFTTFGGQPRNRLAKLTTTGSGAPEPAWNPNANSEVDTLALEGTYLYAGGQFTRIGSHDRRHIARINAQSGAVDPNWNPNADNSVLGILPKTAKTCTSVEPLTALVVRPGAGLPD